MSLSFTSIEIEGEWASSSQNKRTLGGGDGGGGALKQTRTNKGGGASKLGNLERTYFLNVPKSDIFEKLWAEILFKIQLHIEKFSQEFDLGTRLSWVSLIELTCNLQSHIWHKQFVSRDQYKIRRLSIQIRNLQNAITV